MTAFPSGTVTFLFTDLEDGERLWEEHAEATRSALARLAEAVRRAVEVHGGAVFKTTAGACYAAFASAPAALEAALAAQRGVRAETWPEGIPVQIRAALHTGLAQERDGDYFGPPLNRVARLMAAAHGGQTLVSLATYELVRDALPAGVELRDLGDHRLKDLARPEHVYQLSAPDLASRFGPLRTLDQVRTNLPVQPTGFVGRERDLGAVCRLLREDGVRLLTLTGAGGTGKTRLALQVAADLSDGYEDGVYLVELALITEREGLAPAIAQALELRREEAQTIGGLVHTLAERHVLLVLDNFEQLTDAAEEVAELVAGCPRLTVVVTSREVLHLAAEHTYPVPPLAVPDPRHLPGREALSQYDAVALFIQRARAARADFVVTDENALAIAEICVRLDGLPLAIELAAARVRLLPPQALLARLENRLTVLTGGARDLPARQQTLRNAIEWSYDMLSAGERRLFGRLAVFVGGCTLEAAEAVCNAEGDLEIEVFDGVASLADKSLVRQREGADGEPRFLMLQTIREFAGERLQASGEADELRCKHALWCLSVVEVDASWLAYGGPGGDELSRRVEVEHDNIDAALSWCLERDEIELGAKLTWFASCAWRDALRLAERNRWITAFMKPDRMTSPLLRAHALLRLSEIEKDPQVRRRFGREALALYREAEDDAELMNALQTVAGESLYGDVYGRRDDAPVEPLVEEALGLARRLDARSVEAALLRMRAEMAQRRGEDARVDELLHESLAIERAAGYRTGVAYTLHALAWHARLLGDLEEARTLGREALDVYAEVGERRTRQELLLSLVMLALLRRDVDEARELILEGLREHINLLGMEDEARLYTAVWLIVSARSLIVLGRSAAAATLWGSVEGTLIVEQEEVEDIARLRDDLVRVRGELGPETYESAVAAGKAMSLSAAARFALSELEASLVAGSS
jgi:predicted ATPase/class 3 adenylate cyclase